MQTELEKLKARLFQNGAIRNVKFFPGANRDRGPEDWARQLNAFFASAEVDGLKLVDLQKELDD